MLVQSFLDVFLIAVSQIISTLPQDACDINVQICLSLRVDVSKILTVFSPKFER
jgi:hypothetical protein